MFSGKKMLKTLLFLLICISLVLTLPLMVSADEVVTNELKTLYLHPNVNWETDNAWFVLYYFDYNDHYDCVPMTDEDGDGIYEAVLPDGYPNFLFYRMDATVTEFNGDYVLHQTDCFEYAENMQCYALAENSWEAGNWEAAPVVVDVADDTIEDTVSDKTDTPVTDTENSSDSIAETQSDIDETASIETENEITDITVPEDQTNTDESVSEKTETETFADNTEESAPKIETKIFYFSLEQVDQEFTWKIQTSEADYDVTEETEDIYSVELPADAETIIIYGEKEDHQISSVEISLTDIKDNNCIVALACKGDVGEFEIKWGIYDPETEEITFDVEENLVSIEYTVEETTATEPTEVVETNDTEGTENTEETEYAESAVSEEVENSEDTDVVS